MPNIDAAAVTQGLLKEHGIRRRSSSISFLSTGRQDLDGMTESAHGITKDEHHPRRNIQSSNTWTSSSGEILPERDDIEDRTAVVEEYNRLAKRVSRVTIWIVEQY